MVSIYNIKPLFQQFLRPTLEYLVKRKVTPNAVTLVALFGSIIIGALITLARFQIMWLLVLPIWLFIRMALNAIDGMLAREFNMTTNLGAILNELGDVISDLSLYFPLIIINKDSQLAIALFCIGALITEFCGVLGHALKVKRHYEGPMGKSDRAFFVGLLALLTIIFPIVNQYWNWVFLFGTVLTVWTSRNRIKGILEETEIVKGSV